MIRTAIAAALLLTASAASAQFSGPSSNPRAQATTVAQVANARPGSYVTLTGHIVDHQREDYYTFRDSTGEIRVEIEDEDFRGQKVTPETQVRLTGEIDTGLRGRYIDVDTVEILK